LSKLWISGEVQADVGDSFRRAGNAIEGEVNQFIEGISLGEKVKEWAYIAIIRKEDHPDYDEVIKKSSRGKALEFRLKISHVAFASASPNDQIRLMLQSLSRSVTLMAGLGVATETRSALQSALLRAEQDLVGSSGSRVQ
jgi:hypothetical protein